jgi:hypothetical protein
LTADQQESDMATDPTTLPIDDPTPTPIDPPIVTPADPGAEPSQPPARPTQPDPDTAFGHIPD